MPELEPLPVSFHRRPADVVARELLGQLLVRRLDGETLVARVVESEAYLGVGERASHAWRGVPTERTRSLYRAGGVFYVYFVYGMHHCLNVVAGEEGDGSAVLLRAVEPVAGAERMRRLRGWRRRVRPGDLAGGPAKLCRALAVDRELDGAPADGAELAVCRGEAVPAERVAVGPRVGVDYAGDDAALPLRFAEEGNRHVSRPWPWRFG